MGCQQTLQPTYALIKKPVSYPASPSGGKIEMLWDSNYHSLYHRLSPYTNYDSTLIHGFTKEPFFYTYIDESGEGLTALRKFDTRAYPAGSAPIDVIRISKFLGSGRGITFLGKQLFLQTGNPYNETRIYNPTSPIVAAGMGLALNALRPMRHIDTSGGLLGIAQSLIGSAANLFGQPKTNPPSGTTGLKALSDTMKSTGGKGLLRAGTAGRGKSHLETEWASSSGGSTKSFTSSVKGMVTSLFQNFIPQNQDGIEYKSDEGAYGLMIGAGNTPESKFSYITQRGVSLGLNQRWIGGSNITRKNNQYPAYAYLILSTPYERTSRFLSNTQISSLPTFQPVGKIGYTISKSKDITNPGFKYGDSIGNIKNEEFESSDIMIQHSFYVSENYPTKKTDKKSVDTYTNELKKVIDKIEKIGSGKLYSVNIPTDSRVISGPSRTKDGYNRLFATTQGQDRSRGLNFMNYPIGVISNYRDKDITMVDDELKFSGGKTYKLPTNGTVDAINTLIVLDKDRSIASNYYMDDYRSWEPYKDDLIALCFYDVVNEKYIPFRSAIKGVSEAINASWEEMPFIGRADRVYSYGGFTRVLSFNLHIVISSIIELFPTWQRINYICTACKPSNYTTAKMDGGNDSITNRFIVPPMFMLTIGDLYRDQPILFQSITITVPDDASWETLNEDNSDNKNWDYLAKIIKAPGIKYGQFPREVDIGFNVVLLEKERAVVGGANFGHAPRNETWSDWNYNIVPNSGEPKEFHRELVVNVINQSSVQKEPSADNPIEISGREQNFPPQPPPSADYPRETSGATVNAPSANRPAPFEQAPNLSPPSALAPRFSLQ